MDTDDVIPAHHAASGVADARLMVAELDAAVVGWTLVLRLGEELCLAQISVDPRHQRQGIGTALLHEVIDRARAAGERSLVLNTQADVSWNRPWYERHGFVVVVPGDWTPALREVTDYQTDDGLDWTTRVHMRLWFESSE
jgi:4-diphosphocytidyl-2-C-methyl-D-erythritol kinase